MDNSTIFGAKVMAVTLVRRQYGTDRLSFQVDCPTPFPTMSKNEPGKYPAHFIIEVEADEGLAWLKQVTGIEEGNPILRVIG